MFSSWTIWERFSWNRSVSIVVLVTKSAVSTMLVVASRIVRSIALCSPHEGLGLEWVGGQGLGWEPRVWESVHLRMFSMSR